MAMGRYHRGYTMIGQRLQQARDYEIQAGQEIRPEDRPTFHLTPRVGWMNDPNGFSYYGGQYHLFYQYHPYSTKWGPMHWGHAVSKDLLHWTYLPTALAPDTAADQDGCFSGSAVTIPDGRQALLYTGVVNDVELPDGNILALQRQCLAIGDGIDYAKSDHNPLLDETALPAGISRYDFRDPKVWQEVDGTYRMLCAARAEDQTDTMYLLFRSRDVERWNYERVFLRNSDLPYPIGRMYECPDLFELDGQQVLLASSQDMIADGEYAAGNGTFCMIGSYDAATGAFEPESSHNVDYGIDFYAEQSVLAPDGRRIMLGWMQNWDTIMYRPDHCKWFGQMSLPRELTIRNGRLCQWPIRELEAYRCNKVTYQNVLVGDSGDEPRSDEKLPLSNCGGEYFRTLREKILPTTRGGLDETEHESDICQIIESVDASHQNTLLDGIRGRIADLEIEIAAADPSAPYHQFTIGLAVDDTHHTDVTYLPEEALLLVDRRHAGTRRALAHVSSARVTPQGETRAIRLRIILDRYSAEIFVNDGEQVLTTTFYTEQTADRITFSARGTVQLSISKYDLEI